MAPFICTESWLRDETARLIQTNIRLLMGDYGIRAVKKYIADTVKQTEAVVFHHDTLHEYNETNFDILRPRSATLSM